MPTGSVVDTAVLADRLGFDTVLAGEVTGPEAFALLGAIAARTERIRVGSGIVPVATRSPSVLAMGFATLASLAPGRVVAGLGCSTPLIVRQWHGTDYPPPIGSLREVVGYLRAAFRAEKTTFAGQHVQVSGFRLTSELGPVPPIWLGVFNPRMLELAGAIADGVLLSLYSPRTIGPAVRAVHEAARRAGRDPAAIEIAASFWAYCGPRQDEAMVRLRRQTLAYAALPSHRRAFDGVLADLDEVGRRWHASDRVGALELVGEDVVRTVAVVGTGEDVLRHADALRAQGVTLPVVHVVGASIDDRLGPAATVSAAGSARQR